MKILSLSSKHFLTGLAPSAHAEAGGILFKADGVTPTYDAGGTASVENGLLQAGPAPTDFTGGSVGATVLDTIIGGYIGLSGGDPYLMMIGNAGHFYLKAAGAGDVIDRAVTNQIANPANGVTVWAPAGGTALCYYWQRQQIGTYDMTGNNHPASPDAHWIDNAYTFSLSNQANHPVHQFEGNVYYGNGSYVGALLDNGSGGVTHSENVLDFPFRLKVTAISDDGTYLVVAVTENSAGNNTFANNRIVFWDTFSAQWTREYEIRDPFIWALKKVGNVVYAFGQYGIYECSFGGVRKILSRLIGFGTMTDLAIGYGANRALVYNGSALLFATDTTVDTFGKLSPDLQNAYFKHFKIPAGGTPSFVSADLDVGRIYVATDNNKLYAYDFNAATRGTGVTAQTVYIPLGGRYTIDRVDVYFGEPLATGDSMTLQLKSDEDTSAQSATSLKSASCMTDGVIRVKPMRIEGFEAEQLSVIVNFVAGAVKIKRIDVWGSPVTMK